MSAPASTKVPDDTAKAKLAGEGDSDEIPYKRDDAATKTVGVETANASSGDEGPRGDGEASRHGKLCRCLMKFYVTNQFLILIILAIALASAYPPIGAIYLAPHITATWIAVMIIFLLAGLGLKTEEFSNALQQIKFNLFVFVYSFGVDSSFVFGFSRLLTHYNVIHQDLADGMVIAASLPLTINMCVVLTTASGGDEAAAICNTALWNLVGVVLSPALILGYLGESSTVNVGKVFYKLAIRVVLPIVMGQLLKWFVPAVNDFVKDYKHYFKHVQMYLLVFIVYTVFCKTFSDEDLLVPVKDTFLMIVFVGISLAILMVLAWYLLKLFFKRDIKLRVTGLYGCTHKTIAMGIPLIQAIYDGNPAIGLYTLPLLIWHPMQLIVGTFLAPRLLVWVEASEEADYQKARKLEMEETASAGSKEIDV